MTATPAVLWGAFTANSGPEAFEQLVGRKMSLYQTMAMWAQGYLPDGSPKYLRTGWPALWQKQWDAGRLVLHTWGSYDSGNRTDPAFALSAIAGGSQDAFLHGYARDVAAWKHPLFIRFNGEMNGSWEPYFDTPANFVACWRHVVDVFRAEGATNVTWVWCPNVSAPLGARYDTAVDRLPLWYPGDDYVDWTGFDTYNWSVANGGPWMTFEQTMLGYANWYGNTYDAIVKLAPTKPMMLGEFACNTAGGNKAAWIGDALAKIPTRFPQVRAISWFNAADAVSPVAWPLAPSDGTAAAFREGISDFPYVQGGTLALPDDLVPIAPYTVNAQPERSHPDVRWEQHVAALDAAARVVDEATQAVAAAQAGRDQLAQQLATAQQDAADAHALLQAAQMGAQAIVRLAGVQVP